MVPRNPGPPQPSNRSPARRWLPAILLAQVGLLFVAGIRNADQLNADGVAYLRLAQYSAEGRFDLAVSGYWGPLLSWLLAPLLGIGAGPLAAARCVMAVTALGFGLSALALLRRLRLPEPVVVTGYGLAALAGVSWSVEQISPDLLLAGWVGLALAVMIGEGWPERKRTAIGAGLVWGMAALAKPVGLPLAVGLTLLTTVVRNLADPAGGRRAWRQAGITLSTLAVVLAPWVGVVSAKEGRLTFSTSARAAHAVVGPPGVDRYHPYGRTLHQPETGRITAWEDPTSLPYAYWTPWESVGAFRHQLAVSGGNLVKVWRLLGSFDLLHLGVVGATALLLGWMAGQRPKADRGEAGTTATARRIRDAGGSVAPRGLGERGGFPAGLYLALWTAGLGAVYLPGYLGLVDQRYFYMAFPWLFAAATLAGRWLAGWMQARSPLLAVLVWPLVLVSFGVPALLQGLVATHGVSHPAAQMARKLAARIEATEGEGPVAGSGMIRGDRAGLFTAYFLGQPWLGDDPDGDADRFAQSGARWVVLNGRRPLAERLGNDGRFRERTAEWIESPGGAAPLLRVFEVVD